MANKPYGNLNELDLLLRLVRPVGMTNGIETYLTIKRVVGFELFNDRPYHNYETWSDGWEISDGEITVTAEDLDDAVYKYVEKKNPDTFEKAKRVASQTIKGKKLKGKSFVRRNNKGS